MRTLTHSIDLSEHPDRAKYCEMFYGTYFDTESNFAIDRFSLDSLSVGQNESSCADS